MSAHRAAILFGLMVFAGATPAAAAGGADVVDDDAVETPGACHFESWITHESKGAGLIMVAPACTRRAMPNLELGGFVTHGWGPGGRSTAIGLSPKWTLQSESKGLGIGLSGSIGYGFDRSRFETAALIVPVTVPVNGRVRLNLNGGWQWTRAGNMHDLFVGGQIEAAVAPKVNMMVEAFTLDKGKPGGQARLRWTVGRGAIDIDMLAGRYIDGSTPSALTLCVTVRR